MTFEYLCKRWSISPYSSKSVYYDLLKGEGILTGETKPYTIHMDKLVEYEKKIGFVSGMIKINDYSKKYNLSKFKVNQLIKNNEVKYCILCKTEKQNYYRVLD